MTQPDRSLFVIAFLGAGLSGCLVGMLVMYLIAWVL